MKIGLTGGIASGKSTVAAMFAELGVTVIDSDVIAREVVEPGQPALMKIVEVFGPEVLDTAGRLDRRRMRERVFGDKNERKKLEAILHPVIRREVLAQAGRATGSYQVLVIPLLLETGMDTLVDRVLVVDSPPQMQLKRLVARDKETDASARRVIEAQMTRTKRLAGADDVLVNDGDLNQLRASVRDLHKAYSALAI
ncbi:MAG: dephospho-CoA kinase [Gammaproteobacteria bacterium]|nr:dephospho-CoA kinase [Gammaproteobacteria bacterium]